MNKNCKSDIPCTRKQNYFITLFFFHLCEFVGIFIIISIYCLLPLRPDMFPQRNCCMDYKKIYLHQRHLKHRRIYKKAN